MVENGESLRRSWRTAQQIADHFWKRFAKEVVPALNMPTRWFKKAEPLVVGDPVMIADESRRGAWTRGRVVEAIRGKRDEQVRQVRVKTANGIVMRPTVKVAKIDGC